MDGLRVWANDGGVKVPREATWLANGLIGHNGTWDGRKVHLFGARQETVSAYLVLEATADLRLIVSLDRLSGPEGEITTVDSPPEQCDDFRGRNIELFFVRYHRIKGVSRLSYEHYDERHTPARLRRPHDGHAAKPGTGWLDRPDHDQEYPEIAIPIEFYPSFAVKAGTNQGIWIDVFAPKAQPPGYYLGNITVENVDTGETQLIPIGLEVLGFALPDEPSARTMLYISRENIANRYLGEPYPDDQSDLAEIVDRHFQLAHRHRVSLIDEHTTLGEMYAWRDRLDGSLFTAERGYDGPGIGVGNNVYCIGAYGTWPYRDAARREQWADLDLWARWFAANRFVTRTDVFVYLIDESQDYGGIESWSNALAANPGPGKRIRSMATLAAPAAVEHCPSLGIACSTVMAAIKQQWHDAWRALRKKGRRWFWLYNGWRPASPTFTTEDDGVALRALSWCQFKKRIWRWFAWEGTYYQNFQGGTGETDVFNQAQTFGGNTGFDSVFGETGPNYNNGDGVLFYPGVDRLFPDSSYGVEYPFASLRLKHWRRGLQDHDYLWMASRIDPKATNEVVRRLVPKVLWELDVPDKSDPTWTLSDISWPTDPDVWDAARRGLASIILRG